MHSANDNKDLHVFITKFWYSGEHRPREKLKSPLTKLKKQIFLKVSNNVLSKENLHGF